VCDGSCDGDCESGDCDWDCEGDCESGDDSAVNGAPALRTSMGGVRGARRRVET
jgi:hypothetical protein